jgi:hypothetical protein
MREIAPKTFGQMMMIMMEKKYDEDSGLYAFFSFTLA